MMRRKRQILTRSKRNALQADNQNCSPTFGVSNGVTDTPTKLYDFDSQSTNSQTDICDVGWQSSSPISLTQAARISQDDDYAEEREAAIRKLVENSVPTSLPSCTPPLHELITDHRIEPERTKAGAQLLGSQRRGRPKGIKAAIINKEFITKFSAFIEQSKEELNRQHKEIVAEVENSVEDGTIRPVLKSARIPKDFPDSEPLFTEDVNQSFELFTSTQINRDVIGNTTDANKGAINSAGSPQIIRKLDGSPLIPNRGLARKVITITRMSPKYASSPAQSPLAQGKVTTSYEELWTDEEMFDDSLILKATQDDMFATPKAQKRTNTNIPTSNPKVPRHKFNLSSLSPIRSVNDTIKISNPAENSVNSKQLPFQSYYAKNKSSSGVVSTHSVVNHKEHYTNNKKPIDYALSASRENRNPGISCKPIIVPVKNATQTVSCVQSRSESRVTSTSSVIVNKAGACLTAAIAMGPPNITSKPLNSGRQNVLSGKKFQDRSGGVNFRQTAPLPKQQNILTSGRTSQEISVKQASNSLCTSTVAHQKNGDVAPTPTLVKPCSTTRSLIKPCIASSSEIKPVVKSTTQKTCVTAIKPSVPSSAKNPGVSSKALPGQNREQLNVSLTDDLLATLAEPDELLDSQVQRKVKDTGAAQDDDSDDLLLMVKDAVEIGFKDTPSQDKAKVFHKAETDDFFASDEDDPQLLAVLDEAETQHSQEKKVEKSTVKNVNWTFKKTAKNQSARCMQAGIAQQSTCRTLNEIPPSNSANLPGSQRCSPEEIERKKRDAMLRRQNRLKLKR